METVLIPSPQMTYERKYIEYFKDFDWSTATKEDCVQFAQAFGFPETGMSVNEIALIYDILEAKRPKIIVELGRNYGCSTRISLQYIIRHGGTLYSWDLKHWPGFIQKMNENGYSFVGCDDEDTFVGKWIATDGSNLPGNVWLRVAHSIKAPVWRDIELNGVDFLLIDTEHGLEHALGEYMRWREYLKAGSFVAFHDSELAGPKRAIEMVKEVEANNYGDRLIREYKNEHIDGFGIHVLEWKG